MGTGDGRGRIDLSHVVEDGMVTYKGLPAPVVCDFLSREASRDHYAPGTEFQIGTVQLCANTGTYVDSPFHRYRDGRAARSLDPARRRIPICEHLTNLAALPADGFRFSAVPVKVRGMGTFPVRSYAIV